MKKIYLLLFLFPLLFTSHLRAQGNIEPYLLRDWSPYNKCLRGAGFGMNILSDTLSFSKNPNLYSPHLQFGIGFHVSNDGYKTVKDVPLSAPDTGLASVFISNMNVAAFAMARCVSGHTDRVFVPYFDLFGGYRFMTSEMSIRPYNMNFGKQNETRSMAAKSGGVMLGAGIGVHAQTRMGKTYLLFDSELMWNYTPAYGEMADLHSMHSDALGLYLDKEAAPANILMLKVGMCFYTTPGSDDYEEAGSSSSGHSYSHSNSHSSGGHSSVHVHSGGGKLK